MKQLLTAMVMFCAAATSTVHAAEPEDLGRMKEFMGIMEGYYSIIDGVHSVASDREKSAIQQLQKIEEIYKNRGDRAQAIVVLKDVVERTSNDTIRNAAAVMLADALNETGQASEAVEVLKSALERNL
jgi:predicted Zn-dependent protease